MASAIFHHAMTAEQAQRLAPLDTTTMGAGSASAADDSTTAGGSATISANDFLTLLVTEMQNQDPTADTDPNEYINQLVQVNSLEQLIDINQTLSGDVSGEATSSASSIAGTSLASATGDADPASGNQSVALAPQAWSKTSEIMKAMHIGGGTSLGTLGALGQTGIASAGTARAQKGVVRAPASALGGNLGIEKTNPAAARVGHALAGRSHAAVTAAPSANGQ